MVEFTVQPYAGAHPILFGMTPPEVAALLGPPSWSFRDAGILTEERSSQHVNVAYSDDRLNEAVFSKGAKLVFDGQDLFDLHDPVGFLRKFDTPYVWVGVIILLDLGIRLSGLLDDNASQRTISIVEKGYWDEYKEDFLRYEG